MAERLSHALTVTLAFVSAPLAFLFSLLAEPIQNLSCPPNTFLSGHLARSSLLMAGEFSLVAVSFAGAVGLGTSTSLQLFYQHRIRHRLLSAMALLFAVGIGCNLYDLRNFFCVTDSSIVVHSGIGDSERIYGWQEVEDARAACWLRIWDGGRLGHLSISRQVSFSLDFDHGKTIDLASESEGNFLSNIDRVCRLLTMAERRTTILHASACPSKYVRQITNCSTTGAQPE